ncbi:hypothetical protein FEK33_12485 [Nocardia asteroides NBRC 15531]|uniref:esterase/lipase family protein n=1 Tax=Nocardia asteroides TaxID=1824 RepID=UPI0002F7233E|nr:hypothetical protein [Nocardia asteroides]TLF66842.1 hypothetical protein FEK33_12485 [Nocardia asteroides NBRC 15531]UGT51913.1 hypothetical protein LT345_15720 [Nocardia asteroides]SFN02543.1 hypothetical protein SAMN05444423_105401 [Nocardia asteroides]VEG35173.1 Extracellular esterase estB precursor [Nocardia asteroides]
MGGRWWGTAVAVGVLIGGAIPGSAVAEPGDQGCVRSSVPVVILAGGGLSGGAQAFEPLRAALAGAGRCAYYVPYGVVADVNGVRSVADSAREIAPVLDRIRATTGSDRVDIVAHSLGALVTHYYAKFLGGARQLAHVALIAPVSKGTELGELVPGGVSGLDRELPGSRVVVAGVTAPIPSLRDVVVGSDVLEDLHRGGLTQPGVRYCVLASRGEVWNTPIETAQFIDEPGVTNQVFEDVFPGVESDHNDMVLRAETVSWLEGCLG